ncbi:hypothetical protein QQZ08_003733 [Neonectria magnoliae]|uniref:Apple domain-containing protein n=1 Tax=Neonectria magnoliae TaxID=2732573 RepID=A0ABR1IAA9_9HYPO
MVSHKHITILPSTTKSTPESSSTNTGIWLGSSTKTVPEPSSSVSSAWLASPTQATLGLSIAGNWADVGPAPLTCWPTTADGAVCSKNGFVNSDWLKNTYQGPEASEQDCEGACTLTPGCASLSYNGETGICYTSTRPFSEADFTPDGGQGSFTWSQIECLECFDNSVLNLGFEDDSSTNDWTLEGDLDLGWFLDNPEVPANMNRALRIGEPTAFADATTTYNPTFAIKTGIQYQFGYRLRIDRNNHIVTPFDAVTFYISTNDEIVYEFTPQGAKGDTIQGKEKFTLNGGEEGDATFQIAIKGTRGGLDYYFDYAYVTW